MNMRKELRFVAIIKLTIRLYKGIPTWNLPAPAVALSQKLGMHANR